MWAVYDKERGMGITMPTLTRMQLIFLADTANGDARAALNAVELNGGTDHCKGSGRADSH